MTKAPAIQYADVSQLYLDPTNPRLGRKIASPKLRQDDILKHMQDWTLDEIATSFLESGFFPQEALIVVSEKVYGNDGLVVVEGNRRLAAIKMLKKAADGEKVPSKWVTLFASGKLPEDFFSAIPYILVKDRKAVSAYLGFRHVTGIKEWNPAEKAQYIAKLIEEENLTYDEVRRKIGSKTPTVRQHYIAYRLLVQMDGEADIDVEAVEDKFSVLYLSLRSSGVQKYLGIDIQSEPNAAASPVDADHIPKLVNFTRWLFGDDKQPPLFTDSRHVDDFGRILDNQDSVEYLERTRQPHYETALRKSGAGEANIVSYVDLAADNVQLALAEAHIFKKSTDLSKAVRRLGKDVFQLLTIFPTVKNEILKEEGEDAGSS